MIANVEITGVGNYKADESTKKYIIKKIGALDRLAPRHARKSIRADVKLAEINQSNGNKYEVEILMYVPDKTITAKDTALNILAATDIVEVKIANQLRKYKQENIPHVGRRKLLDKFKRSYARG